MDKKIINIAVIVDMSKSFVDKNGSFDPKTTQEEIANAARIAAFSDLAVFTTDLHPWDAAEFFESDLKGIAKYPAHNLVNFFKADLSKFKGYDGKTLDGKATSPQLTSPVEKALAGRKTGIIIPKEILFQDPSDSKKISYSIHEVIATFNYEKDSPVYSITPREFMEEDFGYIIAPKNKFNAVMLESAYFMPVLEALPDQNYNVFTFIKEKYYNNGYQINFIVPGVVENICIKHTSDGLMETFPRSRVIVPKDAITPLYGVGLGFDSILDVRSSCLGLSKDVGVEYLTTDEILKQLK